MATTLVQIVTSGDRCADAVRSLSQKPKSPAASSVGLTTRDIKDYYDIIKQCNKFDINELDDHWKFFLLDYPNVVGYMRPQFQQDMLWTDHFIIDSAEKTIRLTWNKDQAEGDRVAFCDAAFDELCQKNAANFGLKGWAESKWWHPIRDVCPGLKIPGPLRGILGIVTTGVHLNVYTVDNEGQVDKLWFIKRSPWKTYPGMLDQIVAGAMDPEDNMDPLATLGREALEETGDLNLHSRLGKNIMRTNRGDRVGTVASIAPLTFYDKKDGRAGVREQGDLEPGLRYVYDIEVSPTFIPDNIEIGDDEDGPIARSVDGVVEDLIAGKWKPNCGLVTLDFLIRKGQIKIGDTFVKPDDERATSLSKQLRRALPFAEFNHEETRQAASFRADQID